MSGFTPQLVYSRSPSSSKAPSSPQSPRTVFTRVASSAKPTSPLRSLTGRPKTAWVTEAPSATIDPAGRPADHGPMEKAASLTRSVAAGEGLRGHVLGQPTVFHIHAVDEDGRACSSGGNAFTVSIRGPSRVSPSLVDHARRRVRVRVGGLCHRQLPRIGAFGRRAHRRLTYHGVSRHAGTRPDAVPHDGTRQGRLAGASCRPRCTQAPAASPRSPRR